jgi:hypothetical protein
MVDHPGHSDGVQGTIEAPITAPVEPVTDSVTACAGKGFTPGASWAIASLSARTIGSATGRPKQVPFCLVAAMPAVTLSAISSHA